MIVKLELQQCQNTEVNIVPCKIHHTGKANVEEYFKVDKGQQRVFLRGRCLQGSKLDVSDGYKGWVLKEVENKRSREEDEDDDDGNENLQETRTMRSVREFGSLWVWGHEQQVGKDDPWASINDWIELATAIHED